MTFKKRKQKKDCGGALRHPQSIFCIFFLIFLVSCQPSPATVTLVLLGDLMLGRGVQPAENSLTYLAPELQSADLAIANLESPLTYHAPSAGPSSGYNLCAQAPSAKWLAAWGLDLVALANNHRYDCGPEGSVETASLLSNLGLGAIGPGPEPLMRQVNGLKLAFFSFDDVLSPLDGAAAASLIHSARAEGALVIVSVHWGLEYQGGASERQKSLAQQFAQAGAALVIGTHPHVLQPAEWIKPGTRGTVSRDTLVLYSLGNALFDQPGLPDTRQSALVLVKLDAGGVSSAHAVPFIIDVPHSRVVAPDEQSSHQILNRLHLP
jgi:poly-gamma-glutamate synthesis protein (capsule biosynthesis protein)